MGLSLAAFSILTPVFHVRDTMPLDWWDYWAVKDHWVFFHRIKIHWVPKCTSVPLVLGDLIHSYNLHVQQAFTLYNKKSHTHTIIKQKLRKAIQYKNKTKIKIIFKKIGSFICLLVQWGVVDQDYLFLMTAVTNILTFHCIIQ